MANAVANAEPMEAQAFWSGKDLKYWNRTRNLHGKDPRIVLREKGCDGLLRGRQNDKQYACVKYEEDGSVPDDLTEDKVTHQLRPLLGPPQVLEETVSHLDKQFALVAYDVVLDPESHGLCNFRVIFGGMRDQHPKGDELLQHVKDVRLVLRRTDNNEFGVVVDVAESSTKDYEGNTTDFDFKRFTYSTYTGKGTIFSHSMLAPEMKLSMVVLVDEDELDVLGTTPPTALASEAFLGDDVSAEMCSTSLTLPVYGGLVLSTSAEGHWTFDKEKHPSACCMMTDVIEDVDLRITAILEAVDGPGSPDSAGGHPGHGGNTPMYYHSHVDVRPQHPVTAKIVAIRSLLGEDDQKAEDPVKAAGGLRGWVSAMLA